jgi:hypothetical protein
MRVTNAQLKELEDIIDKMEGIDWIDGSYLDLFERIRDDNEGGFKYKKEYYKYVIKKIGADIYMSFVLSVNNREIVESKQTWEGTKKSFKYWLNSIMSEIKAEFFSRIKSLKIKKFSRIITKCSPKFNEIYNQAYHAEQVGLDQLCGLGYRKSFEFLVKDYVKREKTLEEKKAIEKMMIMPCINQYVNDDKVKALAHRVLWLGNDHAHYTRLWRSKSLDDLKKLIDIVIEWIDSREQLIMIEQKMSKVEREMPKKTK